MAGMDYRSRMPGFLDLFAAYNAALWPVVSVLWLLTAWALVAWMRKGRRISLRL
jgi:hypothetical protein